MKQKPSLNYTSIGINSETRLYVKRCTDCSFVFVNPRIKRKYESLVYNKSKENYYKIEYVGRKKTLQEIIESEVKRKKKLVSLKVLLELMKNQDLDKDLTLFDFSSGFGNTMRLGRAFGMDVYGVDIDEKRIEVCKKMGLNVAKPDDFDNKFPFIKADNYISKLY